MTFTNGQPADTIVSHPTLGGATVDTTYAPHSGAIITTCTGDSCGWQEWTSTGSLSSDPPEKEDHLLEAALPDNQRQAREHAATCSAAPKAHP